jgi:hypothetical protein
MELDVVFERRSDGRLHFEGTARPQGMTLTFRQFPYELRDVRGTIAFNTDGLTLKHVTGRHGEARITADGTISGAGEKYDIRLDMKDLLLEEDFQKALPPYLVAIWKLYDPRGQIGMQVHAFRDEEGRDRTDVVFLMDGRASFRHRDFPYPVENVVGKVSVEGEDVKIESVRGSHGAMHCTLDGTVRGVTTSDSDYDLTIAARNVPLDDDLVAALQPRSRELFAAAHPTGTAKNVVARLSYRIGQTMDFTIRGNLENAGFCAEKFPYVVSGGTGDLVIRPNEIFIENLAASHGAAHVVVNGKVQLLPETTGVDLHVTGTGLPLDKDLYQALPQEAKETWNLVAPAGVADMELAFAKDKDGRPGMDYNLVVRPQGAEMTFRMMPYPFRNVTGQMVATPGKFSLENLVAKQDAMRAVVNGTVTFGESRDRGAALSVRISDMPINEEFFKALPADLAPLARHVKPGGTCNIDLRKVTLRSTGPAPGPASRPANAAAGTTKPGFLEGVWSFEGAVSCKDATSDIGSKITGSVSGKAELGAKGLAVTAELDVDSVEVEERQLSHVRGRVLKNAASTLLRLEDFSADVHGGQMAGFAEVRLTEPLQYGVSLTVQGVKLEELFKIGLPEKDKKPDVQGLLDGNLHLEGKAGEARSRQAFGTLRISKAQMYKLPVMLGLLHVIYLSVPGDSAFTDGQVQYQLRGDTMTFREIYLSGSAISVVGSGTLNMKTDALKLEFLTGPPGKMPRISNLANQLVEGFTRELVEIQVSGTVKKPVMKTVTLRGVDEVVRRLTNPPETGD